MKAQFITLLAVCLPLAVPAADQLNPELQRGLFEEEANQNFAAAIKAYQAVIATHDSERKLAATALFRLGECYRKLGQTNDAITQYQRLVSEFPDQATLANLSRQNLVGLGAPKAADARLGSLSDRARFLEQAISGLQLEAAQAASVLKPLQAANPAQRRSIAPTLVPDTVLNRLLAELSTAEQKVASLKVSFTAEHPNVRAALDVVQVLDRQIDERVDGIVEGLKLKAEAIAQQTAELKKQLVELTRSTGPEGGRSATGQNADLAARTQLKELLENEITIATRFAAEQRKKVEIGTLAKGEEVRFERDVLNLKRQLIAADGLASAKDRQEWRELLLQEIQLAEEAARWEKQKLENGRTVASEVARLQRDVLILKRELVAFDAAPSSASKPVEVSATAAPSAEAEELARTERLLAQLQGWDLSQLRRLIPTLAPDAEMERMEKDLSVTLENLRSLESGGINTEDKARQRDELRERIAEQTDRLSRRAEEIVMRLEKRAANLRERVARLPVQSASRPSRAAADESGAPTDEEEKEVRRIQALIKDSPDLINAVNVEVTKIRSGELMVPKNGTLLHRAANQGQLSVAKFLLDHGADVGARDEMGRTPLHRAAGNGHRAMVELLLANKADANAKVSQYPDNGSTSLHLAVGKGYRTVCETLLARGADPNVGDASGTLPIYFAVSADDEATLRLLLARGAKANPESGKKGYSPLHSAKATNIARILIEAGAEVDALTAANVSPLHSSASAGNQGVVEVLLAAGANPNLRDKDGKTPLHFAAAGWKASVVGPLIAKGANPNERNSYGGVPLDALIKFTDGDKRDVSFTPQLETLQAFLAGGADPNLTSVGGAPHLFRAVSEGLEEQAEALLKAGADPNAKTDNTYYDPNRRGQTALIRALQGTKRSSGDNSRARSIALVNLLLEHKADSNLAEGSGDTPLSFAIASGRNLFAEKVPFVEALLKHGANIEGRNSAGNTPLVVAVELNMREMAELLLKHKADANAMTGAGKTLLHVAVANKNPELVDMLLAAGANPNALDAQGLSALDYVKSRGSFSSQPGFGGFLPPPIGVPYLPGQPQARPREVTTSDLAERLRKAGARDWAPRPAQITVTRRSTGATQAAFTKGTNDWNRHSLLEALGFTYFGSGSSFPFPDFSKLTVTRLDPASGQIREFSVDLPAKLAADGCQADQWLEWGDLIDIPEGEHKLDAKWEGLPSVDIQAFTKCLARKVTISVKGMVKEIEIPGPTQWRNEHGATGIIRYYPEKSFRLRQTVMESGLLLTSSDTTRVKVKRTAAVSGRAQEWMFDLSKGATPDDLWLRDGDVIEVPER